jgi:hypothetical protein
MRLYSVWADNVCHFTGSREAAEWVAAELSSVFDTVTILMQLAN